MGRKIVNVGGFYSHTHVGPPARVSAAAARQACSKVHTVSAWVSYIH